MGLPLGPILPLPPLLLDSIDGNHIGTVTHVIVGALLSEEGLDDDPEDLAGTGGGAVAYRGQMWSNLDKYNGDKMASCIRTLTTTAAVD